MNKEELIKSIKILYDNKLINEWLYQTIIERISDEEIDLTSKQQIETKPIESVEQFQPNTKVEPQKISITLSNTNDTLEQEENFDDITNKLNSFSSIQVTEKTPQQIKNMLINFTKQIYAIFLSGDLPKYFTLPSKIKIENEKITINIEKRDTRDEKIVNRFTNMTISELKKEFNDIKNKRLKINKNDRTQWHNLTIKTKELSEIARLLAHKLFNEKDYWLKQKNIFDLELKKYK